MIWVAIFFIISKYVGDYVLQCRTIDNFENSVNELMRDLIDSYPKKTYNKCSFDWKKEGF